MMSSYQRSLVMEGASGESAGKMIGDSTGPAAFNSEFQSPKQYNLN